MKPYNEILEYARVANINEAKDFDQKKFDEFIAALQKTKLKVTVKLDSVNDISVECGRDYPDEFANDVDAVISKVGIKNVDICADMSGKVKETIRINGGAKKKW